MLVAGSLWRTGPLAVWVEEAGERGYHGESMPLRPVSYLASKTNVGDSQIAIGYQEREEQL